MSLVLYPANGVDVYAADVAASNAPRTSGVYSSEEDFSVTAAGGRTLTVGAGLGWVRPERFAGYSIVMREPQTITLPLADDTLPRIDRLVLRYDAAAQAAGLQVLQGTAASTPTAPAITRTTLVYDLCLAQISRPAGSTSVTAADITDTRTDESLCGVMRDGVEGIPTGELLAQWQAAQAAQDTEARKSTADLLQALQASADGYTQQWDTAAKSMQAETAKLAGGSFYTRSEVDRLVSSLCSATDLTLAADGWTTCTEEDAQIAGLAYQYDAAVTGCTEELDPHATIERASRAAAQAAGLDGICQTMDGICRFYAARQPTADISLRLLLLGAGQADNYTARLGVAALGRMILGR